MMPRFACAGGSSSGRGIDPQRTSPAPVPARGPHRPLHARSRRATDGEKGAEFFPRCTTIQPRFGATHLSQRDSVLITRRTTRCHVTREGRYPMSHGIPDWRRPLEGRVTSPPVAVAVPVPVPVPVPVAVPVAVPVTVPVRSTPPVEAKG